MRTENTWYSLTLTYHMPQTERIQIITGTSEPESDAHLGRLSYFISEFPFPSQNVNHSPSPYARPSDFKNRWDYEDFLRSTWRSIKDDTHHQILLLHQILSKGLHRWNICHQTFDTTVYTHRESKRHHHSHSIQGSTGWSILDCTVHSPIKNGLPPHSTTCYLHPLSKNDWDSQWGLNSPWSQGQSLWANDSSRDTQHSRADHQGTSDGPNDLPGTSLPDPT